jgi:integrase
MLITSNFSYCLKLGYQIARKVIVLKPSRHLLTCRCLRAILGLHLRRCQVAQTGELKQIGQSWFIRYYLGGKRTMKKLGNVSDFESKDKAVAAYQAFMSTINSSNQSFQPSYGTLLRDFVLNQYFPSVEESLRGSTLRGYLAIWRLYIEPNLGHLRVRDIKTFECQTAMDSIVRDHPELKRASLSRIRSFMSAIFNEAIRLGLHDDKNPVASDKHGNGGIKVRRSRNGTNDKTPTYAYSLDEIRDILGVLSEPSRVILTVAAFAGLRRGEIVGLKWGDYDGEFITVRRNICFGKRGEMSVERGKTDASEAPVPVIGPLKRILDDWKAKAQAAAGIDLDDCWIFPASFTRPLKGGKERPAELLDTRQLVPVSPNNLLRDVIKPALKKAGIEWHGYHSFRRGLATNLRTLGVDDLTISEILRHSDVQVTRQSYIKRVSAKGIEAMQRLEAELARGVI